MPPPRANAWIRGAVAAGLVGTFGAWNGPTVLAFAIAAGLSFFDLSRRDRGERAVPATLAPDPYGVGMELAFLALLSAGAWENRAQELRWSSPGWAGVAGAAVIFAGMGLRQSAARALGRHFTVALAVLDDHELIADGPYRWIRHPNYAGLLMIAVGTALMARSRLALLVALAVWLPLALLRIREEERALHQRLGPRWDAYARDRWMLIPGIY